MTTSLDNGFLVHWFNYQTNVYNLAFYNFAGEVKKTKDITSLMTVGSYKGTMPIDYSFANGISVIDQNSQQWIILDRLSFDLVNKRSLSGVVSPYLPNSFTQNSPALFDFNKVSDVSLYLPNPSYNGGIYITKSDYKSLTDVLYSPDLKQSSQSSAPLIFKDNNNNSYAVYYSVNVQAGGDTITFTVYKNNLLKKTFTFPIKDQATNGAGVQAGAMVGKYNIVDNCIYMALGYKLGVASSNGTYQSQFTDATFNLPSDIEVNSHGVFICTGNPTVECYDFNNNLVWSVKTPVNVRGVGTGTSAYGLTSDLNSLYVSDYINALVYVYDFNGNFKTTLYVDHGEPFGSYFAAGIYSDGTYLYVCDTGNNIISTYTTAGALISTFNCGLQPDSTHVRPVDVYKYNNLLYVLAQNESAGEYGVYVYSLSGVLQFKFGLYGSGNGQLAIPGNYFGFLNIYGGQLFVADSDNNRVQIFNPSNGVYINQFMSAGSGDGQGQPASAFGYNNKIYVSDSANNRVQLFSYSIGIPFAQLINVYRYDLLDSMIELFSYYNKTDPTIEPLYPVDISWDYNKTIHLAIADLNITANTGAFKIIRLDTSSSYTLIATVDTFTSVADLNNQNFFSITDFYMDTRALALSQGDGLLVPNNIESYKAVPVSQGKRGIRNE